MTRLTTEKVQIVILNTIDSKCLREHFINQYSDYDKKTHL